MIIKSNLKKIFFNIFNQTYKGIIIKYWRVFYYIFWWNLKNLNPLTFKIFFKKYEAKYNISKNLFLLNIFLNKKVTIYNNSFYLLQYLNNFLVKYKNNNLKHKLLSKYILTFNNTLILVNKNLYNANYTFYYNFYNIKYLN